MDNVIEFEANGPGFNFWSEHEFWNATTSN